MAVSARYMVRWLAVLFAVMSISMTAFASSEQQWVDAGSAVTVRAIFQIDDPENEATRKLVELTTSPEAQSPLFALTWRQDGSNWVPVWRLYLEVEPSLVPTSLAVEGGKGIRLAPVAPLAGHRYEAALSYDPKTGLLAVALDDLTEQRRLFSNGWQMATVTVPMHGQMPTSGEKLQVSPWYEPVSTQWDIGSVFEGAFTPLQLLETSANNQVRLRTQGALPGEFRFVTGAGQTQQVVGKSKASGSETFVALEGAKLPIGATSITMQYVENGQVRMVDTRPIQVGKVTVTADQVSPRSDTKTLAFDLHVKSESKLPSITLKLTATLSRLAWDASQRGYKQVPYGVYQVEKTAADISPAGVTLPISLPGLTEEGAWRLDLSLSAQPSITVELQREAVYFSNYRPATVKQGDPYVVAVLPDTQNYAKQYPDIYLRQAEWLAANANSKDIAFALHLGDITNDNEPRQWLAARNAHSLMNGVVPYVLSVGNHDYARSGLVSERGTSMINEYFTADDFPQMSGAMQAGRLENTYHTFRVGEVDYLVVSLEFAPPNEALAWANEVVASHPQHKVIVITHAYLRPTSMRLQPGESAAVFPMGKNTATTMNDGEEIWAKFISLHSNIFLVISGHLSSSAIPTRISRGVNGNKVYEVLIDYQSEPNGGNGYLVLFEFGPDNKLTVRSYSPYLNMYKLDHDRYLNGNQFVIDLAQG